MLLLPAPSRRSHDVAISLRAPAGDTRAARAVAEEALGASCPPDKAERVRLSIFHSGRYDCRVAVVAVRPYNLGRLREALSTVRGQIIVLDDDGNPLETSLLH